MTPKDKAEKLVNKFKHASWTYDENGDKIYILDDFDAKECAIICVDEILDSNQETDSLGNANFNSELSEHYSWWEDVKQEIEKL